MEKLFKFTKQDFLGSVINVDSEHVIIQIENESIMTQICVGNLIAIETSKGHQLLIASIDRVTRKTLDDLDDEDDVILSADYVKASIIGTFHAVFGEQKNLFKRGIEAFPKIDSNCNCILGTNLQKLMNILSNNIKTEKKLKLGNFVMDAEANAILDGNKLFQRHAAILGSTGSGKSWCVANILEKSSELNFANIIVFDMHGEYSNLSEGVEKIAESFRIAGPGDLETDSDEIIFLPYWLLNREELLSMILDRSDMNAPNQASRFTAHINNLKAETLEVEKKKDVLKSFTVDSPIPFKINDLISLLKVDDTTPGVGANNKPIKGEWQGKLTRFISRLEAKIQDKRYGFMFQPSSKSLAYEWLEEMMCNLLGAIDGKKGIKIIDFSEVPSDILPVVTGTLARLLYNVQFWIDEESRTPFTFIC